MWFIYAKGWSVCLPWKSKLHYLFLRATSLIDALQFLAWNTDFSVRVFSSGGWREEVIIQNQMCLSEPVGRCSGGRFNSLRSITIASRTCCWSWLVNGAVVTSKPNGSRRCFSTSWRVPDRGWGEGRGFQGSSDDGTVTMNPWPLVFWNWFFYRFMDVWVFRTKIGIMWLNVEWYSGFLADTYQGLCKSHLSGILAIDVRSPIFSKKKGPIPFGCWRRNWGRGAEKSSLNTEISKCTLFTWKLLCDV